MLRNKTCRKIHKTFHIRFNFSFFLFFFFFLITKFCIKNEEVETKHIAKQKKKEFSNFWHTSTTA